MAAGEQIFFGGDTSIHGDLKLYGELYHPHVAMLGVGGVTVHGQSMTELYPEEAAVAGVAAETEPRVRATGRPPGIGWRPRGRRE